MSRIVEGSLEKNSEDDSLDERPMLSALSWALELIAAVGSLESESLCSSFLL